MMRNLFAKELIQAISELDNLKGNTKMLLPLPPAFFIYVKKDRKKFDEEKQYSNNRVHTRKYTHAHTVHIYTMLMWCNMAIPNIFCYKKNKSNRIDCVLHTDAVMITVGPTIP